MYSLYMTYKKKLLIEIRSSSHGDNQPVKIIALNKKYDILKDRSHKEYSNKNNEEIYMLED
ncbi:hypothetical protein ACWYRQ_14565 [Clostridioides difficile]